MNKHQNQVTNPMPKATVAIRCDECGELIAELPLAVNYLAAVLFKVRKEHAKEHHGWQEEEKTA